MIYIVANEGHYVIGESWSVSGDALGVTDNR